MTSVPQSDFLRGEDKVEATGEGRNGTGGTWREQAEFGANKGTSSDSTSG